MSSVEGRIEVRPMNLKDTDAMLSIDREIRAAGGAITYANLRIEQILSPGRKVSPQETLSSYVDWIAGNVAGLLDFSFVAEVDGQVRGFILGQVARLRESATELGIIHVIGVPPDYQRKGIGAKLIDALADKYRSKGIKIMRTGVDHRDKSLIGLVEHMGFGVGRLIVYSKVL